MDKGAWDIEGTWVVCLAVFCFRLSIVFRCRAKLRRISIRLSVGAFF